MKKSSDISRAPFGVTVIATAFLLNAIIAGIRTYQREFSPDSLVDASPLVDILGPAFSLAGLILGVGLWRLQRWAWVGAMLWAGFNMGQALLSYYRGEPQWGTMFLSVIIAFYLNQRDVQTAFLPKPEEVKAD